MDIAPYNNNFFIVIYGKNKSIKFKIYENRTFKIIYELESFQYIIEIEDFYLKNSFYKLNNNEYLFHNFFIKIEPNN